VPEFVVSVLAVVWEYATNTVLTVPYILEAIVEPAVADHVLAKPPCPWNPDITTELGVVVITALDMGDVEPVVVSLIAPIEPTPTYVAPLMENKKPAPLCVTVVAVYPADRQTKQYSVP
jgi:hypothetical protein